MLMPKAHGQAMQGHQPLQQVQQSSAMMLGVNSSSVIKGIHQAPQSHNPNNNALSLPHVLTPEGTRPSVP